VDGAQQYQKWDGEDQTQSFEDVVPRVDQTAEDMRLEIEH
jgi:hypothetical protein